MADKVILYSYYRSSASWRVRIALAMKNIKYEYVGVHLLHKENLTEEYKKLNPIGQLPTLKIDGTCLTQSLPIIEYLDERNPSPPLFPEDKIGRAKVRALSELINSGIQPLQNISVLGRVGEGKEEWARHFITKGFGALEQMLSETAGRYSYGDQVTMADVCLAPQVNAAMRFKVDLGQFPIISRVHEEISKLPAFIEAHSNSQPDTPEDQRPS